MNGRFSEMSTSYDRYHKLLGISPRDQPPTAYRLLGIDVFEGDREVIDAAANKQMAYLQGCCNGEHAADAEELLNEVSKARLQLLSPAAKMQYDVELRHVIEQARLDDAVQAALKQANVAAIAQETATSAPVAPEAPVVYTSGRGRRKRSGGLGWLLPVFVPTLISVFVAWKFGLIDFDGNANKARQPESNAASHSPSLDSRASFASGNGTSQQPAAAVAVAPPGQPGDVGARSSTFFNDVDSNSSTSGETRAYLDSNPFGESMPKSETRERLDSFRAMGRQNDPSMLDANGGHSLADQYTGPRLQVPNDEIESAVRSLKEILASQIREAKSPHDKQHLAIICYQLAMDSEGAAEIYVLLQMAQEYFVAGNDCSGAMRALDARESWFDVDLFSERVAVIKKLIPPMHRPLDQVAAAGRAESMISTAIQREDYEAAIELSELARKLAVDLRNVAMSRKFSMHMDRVALLKKVQPKVEEYRLELELDPDNAAVSEYLGRVLCFGKSDWEEGLPLLSRGENLKLAEIATVELRAPSLADELDELADRWWNLSVVSENDAVLASAAQERAVHWYRQAIAAGLSGLPKAAAESRLDQYETEHAEEVAARRASNEDLREPKPPPGVPRDAIHFNGNWYLFSSKKVDFQTAVAFASQAGGRLVVVRSQAEHDFLVQHARRPLMLGMLLRDGVWYDSLGERQYFFLWDTANSQPEATSGEMTAAIYDRTDLWHDYPDSKLYFAIEWGKE